jgi:hypothetical protein
MGFNRREMQTAQKAETEAESAGRRATDPQLLEDAEQTYLHATDKSVFFGRAQSGALDG